MKGKSREKNGMKIKVTGREGETGRRNNNESEGMEDMVTMKETP